MFLRGFLRRCLHSRHDCFVFWRSVRNFTSCAQQVTSTNSLPLKKPRNRREWQTCVDCFFWVACDGDEVKAEQSWDRLTLQTLTGRYGWCLSELALLTWARKSITFIATTMEHIFTQLLIRLVEKLNRWLICEASRWLIDSIIIR